jgi:GDPmannose 4,6-dehydratase
MLQQDAPDDYVVATGKTTASRISSRLAFAEVGIEDWQNYVRQDPKFFRPAEVDLLIGDPTKARRSSAGSPRCSSPLVKMMVATTSPLNRQARPPVIRSAPN